MNTKNKINMAAAMLCALGGLACAAPAESQNLTDVLRDVLGTNNNTTYYGYGQNSNISPPSAQQSQTMMNLEARRMQ
jgi:hypothetical protein